MTKHKKSSRFIVSLLIFSLLLIGMAWSLPAQEKKVITFWGQKGGANQTREAAQRKMFEKFEEENPNVDVKPQFFPFNELVKKTNLAIGSKSAPDVVYADAPLIGSYVRAGALMPLDEYYTEEELNKFVSSSVDTATVNDHFYGPPESSSALALLYNKEMFREVGIDPEEVPVKLENAWTLFEWLPKWKKLTRDTNGDGQTDVFGLGRTFDPSTYSTLPLIRSFGTYKGSPTYQAVSPDGTSVDGYLNTEKAIEGFQFFQDLFQEWEVANVTPIAEILATGRAATVISTERTLLNIKDNYPEMAKKIGIAPIPYAYTPITHAGSFHYTVSKYTKHPEAAAKLAKFMGNEWSAKLMWERVGQVPARKDTLESIEAYQSYPRRVFMETLREWSVARPQTPGYAEYKNYVQNAMKDIRDGANVENRVAQMVKNTDRALKKYKEE